MTRLIGFWKTVLLRKPPCSMTVEQRHLEWRAPASHLGHVPNKSWTTSVRFSHQTGHNLIADLSPATKPRTGKDLGTTRRVSASLRKDNGGWQRGITTHTGIKMDSRPSPGFPLPQTQLHLSESWTNPLICSQDYDAGALGSRKCLE